MPNWTSNNLTLQAGCDESRAALAHFREKVRVNNENGESEFSFSGHLPMPKQLDIGGAPFSKIKNDEDLLEAMKEMNHPDTNEHQVTTLAKQIQQYVNKKELGYTDWYDWNTKNWGTKWDACDVDIVVDEENCFSVNFNTAWCLPHEWNDAVLDDPQYASLRIVFEWSDEGYGSCIIATGDEKNPGAMIDCDSEHCGNCEYSPILNRVTKEPHEKNWSQTQMSALENWLNH